MEVTAGMRTPPEGTTQDTHTSQGHSSCQLQKCCDSVATPPTHAGNPGSQVPTLPANRQPHLSSSLSRKGRQGPGTWTRGTTILRFWSPLHSSHTASWMVQSESGKPNWNMQLRGDSIGCYTGGLSQRSRVTGNGQLWETNLEEVKIHPVGVAQWPRG